MRADSRAIGAIMLAALLAGCNTQVQRAAEIQRFQQHMEQVRQQVNLDPARPLSMSQCEQLALANSLDLQVRRLVLRLQDDHVGLAISKGLPHGSAVYDESVRSNRNLVQAGPVQSEVAERHQKFLSVQAMMPALDFGLTYYAYRIAVDRRRQERLLIARSEQLLRRDVRLAYTAHAGASRQERLFDIAYQASAQVLRVAKSLEREKMAVRADTALIEAALAQAALGLSNARQAVQETHVVLAQLMSLPPNAHFTIDQRLPALPSLPTSEQVSQYEERALRARPELAVQDLARSISASSVYQEAANFFPHVNLAGAFNWAGASRVVNPAWFVGGFQVTHSLLEGGSVLWRYDQARKGQVVERERTLLVSLGILYDVQLRAIRLRTAYETVRASETLESSRSEAFKRILSLYKEGLEDEAGAARSLADLTIQATALDTAQTAYLSAWHELEAAALPESSAVALPATQPSTQPFLPLPLLKDLPPPAPAAAEKE